LDVGVADAHDDVDWADLVVGQRPLDGEPVVEPACPPLGSSAIDMTVTSILGGARASPRLLAGRR
jgi:hypothetical protein